MNIIFICSIENFDLYEDEEYSIERFDNIIRYSTRMRMTVKKRKKRKI